MPTEGVEVVIAVFNVSLVVDGLGLEDEKYLDVLFDELPDALVAQVAGTTTIAMPVDAPDAEHAAREFIGLVTELLPDVVPVRLDPDLVSVSDIAERAGRSRESIRLLADGKRGPGGFPPAVGVVGDGIRVWPWAVIVDWFARALDEHVDDPGIPPAVAARIDAELATVGI